MSSKETDSEFAKAMIKHHQMALKMARMYIEEGDNSKLLDLCEKIISKQTAEIDLLSKYIKV